MAITKTTKVDQIEVLEDGQMQVREAVIIEEDGVELSRSFHRYVIDVDEEIPADADQLIKDVANGNLRSEERLAKRQAHKDSLANDADQPVDVVDEQVVME